MSRRTYKPSETVDFVVVGSFRRRRRRDRP